MADDASLPELVLRAVHSGRYLHMTLQAERVHASGEQHARIDRCVRGVACLAALNPDRFVLVNKGSALVAVALQANQVLVGRRAELGHSQRAVRIVAIGALDQPLFHAMAEGLLEVHLLFLVAGEAQARLLAHQLVLCLGGMNGVAGIAADAVLVVYGAQEITLLGLGLVAGHAALAGHFRLGPFEGENLGLVAAPFDVQGTGTVARLAAVPLAGKL